MNDTMKSQVKKRHKHAAGCKKFLSDCPTCQDNVKWFNRLSLTDLSEALTDRGRERK